MVYRRGRYYYRSRRSGQRVETEYLGTGALAELIAEADACDQQLREQQRMEARAEQEAQRQLDRSIAAVGHLTQAVVQAVLLASGYHVHKGQWRKRRDGRQG